MNNDPNPLFYEMQFCVILKMQEKKLREPDGGAGRRTGGAEGDCNPIRRSMLAGWTTQCSQGLDHQPRRVHGGTHGSRCICSRGCHCLTSMGGEALGPMEI